MAAPRQSLLRRQGHTVSSEELIDWLALPEPRRRQNRDLEADDLAAADGLLAETTVHPLKQVEQGNAVLDRLGRGEVPGRAGFALVDLQAAATTGSV